MALDTTEQTEKILLHHWQAFGAGDVEAIMADYAAVPLCLPWQRISTG
jgi:hypothetical protein